MACTTGWLPASTSAGFLQIINKSSKQWLVHNSAHLHASTQ
jgi:hypothetical protein